MGTQGKLNVYESIMERVKRDIALGIVSDGQRLPSCRDLALELGVNPNTVQRAYATLEEEGFLYTIPKKGVYVKGKEKDVLNEAREYLSSLKKAGARKAEIEKIIEEIWEEKQQ